MFGFKKTVTQPVGKTQQKVEFEENLGGKKNGTFENMRASLGSAAMPNKGKQLRKATSSSEGDLQHNSAKSNLMLKHSSIRGKTEQALTRNADGQQSDVKPVSFAIPTIMESSSSDSEGGQAFGNVQSGYQAALVRMKSNATQQSSDASNSNQRKIPMKDLMKNHTSMKAMHSTNLRQLDQDQRQALNNSLSSPKNQMIVQHEMKVLQQENDELRQTLIDEKARVRPLYDEIAEQKDQIDNFGKVEEEVLSNRKTFMAELSANRKTPLKQENDELHRKLRAYEQEEAAQRKASAEEKIWMRRLYEKNSELQDQIKKFESSAHEVVSSHSHGGDKSDVITNIEQENDVLHRELHSSEQNQAPLHGEVADLKDRVKNFENAEHAIQSSNSLQSHTITNLRQENGELQQELSELARVEHKQRQTSTEQTEQQLTIEALQQRIACLSRNNAYQQSIIMKFQQEKEEHCSHHLQISQLEREKAEQRDSAEGYHRHRQPLDQSLQIWSIKDGKADHHQVLSPGTIIFSARAPETSTPRSEGSTSHSMYSAVSAPPRLAGTLATSSSLPGRIVRSPPPRSVEPIGLSESPDMDGKFRWNADAVSTSAGVGSSVQGYPNAGRSPTAPAASPYRGPRISAASSVASTSVGLDPTQESCIDLPRIRIQSVPSTASTGVGSDKSQANVQELPQNSSNATRRPQAENGSSSVAISSWSLEVAKGAKNPRPAYCPVADRSDQANDMSEDISDMRKSASTSGSSRSSSSRSIVFQDEQS